MKWPFSRRQDVTSVPEEIREYYQTERRERTGIAWLLALGTLIVTVVVAMALFFAGRWIYRTVVDRDDNNGRTTEQAVQDDSTQKTESSDNQQTSGGTGSNTPATNPPAANTPSSATTPATTPANNNSGTPLPNTGPGDLVGLFALVVIATASTHYAISRRLTE